MKKIKLQFRCSVKGGVYSAASGVKFRDGEIKDIPEAEALRILKDFPDNFTRADIPKPVSSDNGSGKKGKAAKAEKDK